MIERDDITLEMLSAHVDGALSSEDAARVGRAAAEDSEISARLAVLLALRAGVSGLVDETAPASSTRLIRDAVSLRRLRHQRRTYVAIASVLVLALGVTVWTFDATRRMQGPAPLDVARIHSPAIAPLIGAYDAWAELVPSDALPVGSDLGQLNVLMRAAGLERDFTTEFALKDGATVLHTGFLGHLGCRLSLFETAPAGGAQGLSISVSDDLLLATWATSASSFVVIARNMNSVRFTTISSALAAATTAPAEDEAPMIALLSGMHQHCVA